ncbi:MAG: hypothetical protein KAS32_12010, partial [Candidatus Peribacteraceae bacterium]|nr:hypothetical protein [Candidatus Peribacteraceae bacterium]
VKNVREFKSRGADENNNFVVECKAPNGLANISGFQIGNARMLKEGIKAKSIEGAEGVYTQESIKDILSNSVLFNTLIIDDQPLKLPDELNVVGAFVNMDADEKPLIALRRYKGYNQCLNHHRTLVGDDETFMSRDDFKSYLGITGEGRPAGIPDNLKTLTLNAGLDATDMSLWSFNLLLEDVKA